MSALWGDQPRGLVEALVLEQAAVIEHEARAAWLWAGRRYEAALAERAAAAFAGAEVKRLQAELKARGQ